MHYLSRFFFILLFVFSFNNSFGQSVSVWLTDPSQNILFQPQKGLAFSKADGKETITINPKETFQTIDGFGYTLSGGSAQHLMNMTPDSRKALLKELFGTEGNNIGTSYLRLSIGASDLNEKVFSYNDLPNGKTDVELKKFDLGQDKKDVVPILKEILKINPKIKLMGSPWSPPTWMKTNADSRGGSLKPEYYAAYALYFVKYIQAMKGEGIVIDAVTVQNEPLHPGNNPSLLMLAQEQAEFVKKHLGPAFEKAKIKTKIIIYDHNADKPEYPISILDDADAKKYIDGSAFHLYGGKIEALSKVHEAHPDKNLYFTEQWVGGPGNINTDFPFHVEHLIIGATRNWAKTVLEWNLAANSKYEPFTDRGGCKTCLGAVTIDGNEVKRNPAYYIIAQASKFVRPGSVRVASNSNIDLPNVVFKTPDGKLAMVVINRTKNKKDFTVNCNNKAFQVSLNSNAAATLVW